MQADHKLAALRKEKRYFANKQRVDYYFSLHTSGLSINKIAEKEGITKQRVSQLLKSHPDWGKD